MLVRNAPDYTEQILEISPLRETYGWEEIATRAKAEREALLTSHTTDRPERASGASDGPGSQSGVFYLAIGWSGGYPLLS